MKKLMTAAATCLVILAKAEAATPAAPRNLRYTPGSSSGGAVRPTAGCGLPGSSGRQDLTVTIRGVQRRYRVQFPSSYDPNTPLPLVFYFHWLGGTINDAIGLYEAAIWDVGNASSEAAFVWAQGLPITEGQTDWDYSCGGSDVEFFDAMLAQISADRCVDLNRVFSAGFSSGADMSTTLACCRGGEVVRAVAPAAGEMVPDSCPAAIAPALRFSYGTEDTAYTQEQFQEVPTYFRDRHGCGSGYDPAPVSDCRDTWTENGRTVTCACRSYQGCDDPVIECIFTNMPHTTPAGWREDTRDFFKGF